MCKGLVYTAVLANSVPLQDTFFFVYTQWYIYIYDSIYILAMHQTGSSFTISLAHPMIV